MNIMPDLSPATFEAFYQLGYTRLVPIVTPDAEISERSSLYKRVGTSQDPRGKAPGVKGRAGLWFGYDWVPHESDTHDLAKWQQMGAGIGIKTGQCLIGIDADTLNPSSAGIIRDIALKHFGPLPTRIGQSPKALFLCRTTEPMQYTRIEFGELDDKGRLKDRVEILSDGRQFVAHGIHPKTLMPYAWTRPPVAKSALPEFTPQQIVAFLEELRTLLPAAKPLIVEGATTDVSQASLKGSLETIRKAVQATPNNSTLFGTREAYRDFGYAIKAALPEQDAEAFDIYSEWCGRWEEGTNDPDIVAADWRRMKPPYRRGANWLYELAEQNNPAQFSKADAWFEEIPEEVSLFGNKTLQHPLEEPEVIKWVDPKDWEGVTPPPRKWRIAGMVPDGEVTLLTGMGGVGKTLLAQQAATAVSQGALFLGRETVQCKVMLFLCEDSEDELQNRQHEINIASGLDMAEISPWLRIASRKYMDNLLAIWDRNTGTMKRTKVWEKLRSDALAFGAKLIIVDTIADTFGGSEIDRTQVRQFVQACLGKLAQDIGGAVLALGHPSKSGQAKDGDGTSGSTAWHATVRSRLYLKHASEDRTGPFRRMESMKANYGASGDVFMLRWHRGAFDLVSSKTTAPAGDATGGAVVLAGAPSMGNVIDDAILAAVSETKGDGVAMSDARNSPYWAPRVLRRLSDILALYPMKDIEASWQRVVKAGRVQEATVGRKANRMPVMGYELALRQDMLSVIEDENVFD